MAEDSFQISAGLQDGVERAFEVARKILQEQEGVCFFVYFSKDGKSSVAMLNEFKSRDEAEIKLKKWFRSEPKIVWFVEVWLASLAGTDEVDAIVAHCAERGQKQGLILFQRIQRGDDGKYVGIAEIDFMKRFPNDFFETNGNVEQGAAPNP